MEGQVLYELGPFNFLTGGGVYDIDADRQLFFDEQRFTREQDNGYVYLDATVPEALTWTIGLSYDRFDQDRLDANELNPKVGLQWDITKDVRLRAAAFHVVKRALVAQQTIEPTEVAGFNQFFDDFNGTKAWRYGAALDVRLTDTLYLGLEGSRRNLEVPAFVTQSSFVTEDRDEDLLDAYLYWIPHVRWVLSSEAILDRFKSEESLDPDLPKEVDTFSVPLGVRYFDPSGIFAAVTGTYVYQDVDRRAGAEAPEGKDGFFLFDAALGYRLPKRVGLISIEVRNLLNQGFNFQDDNFRTSEDRNPPFVPDRTILARLALNF